jgi:beta-lactamase class A
LPDDDLGNTNVQQPQTPVFVPAKFSKALSTWGKQQTGDYSVVVTDNQGEVLASANGDASYFAASIYKIYVAYVGYQRIDDGTYKASEPYLGGWTRGKCLDEMIRTSNSPCAEKMWVELGKENLNTIMKNLGIKNTSMTGITTTAVDAALMMKLINNGDGLSESSQKLFMNSMTEQIYRDGLPKGFGLLKVSDKVGFRGEQEYHDVGIVELTDKRVLIVSVLTTNVGEDEIAKLATALLDASK